MVFLLAALAFSGGCRKKTQEDLIQSGEEAFANNQMADAIRFFEEAALSVTNQPNLFYNLGLAYYRRGELDAADKAFGQALAIDPAHLSAQEFAAVIAIVRRDFRSAQTVLRPLFMASRNKEERARVGTRLAQTYYGMNRRDAAHAVLLSVMAQAPTDPVAAYDLAQLYASSTYKLLPEARDFLSLYLAAAPADDSMRQKAEALMSRVEGMIERQKSEQAKIMRDTTLAAQFLQTALRAQAARRPADAEKAFKDALRADPLSPEAAAGLAKLLEAQQGREKEAFEAWQTYIKRIDPSNAAALLTCARLGAKLKLYSEAIAPLTAYLAQKPKDQAQVQLMVTLLYYCQRTADARVWGEYCLSLIPQNSPGRQAYAEWVQKLPVE